MTPEDLGLEVTVDVETLCSAHLVVEGSTFVFGAFSIVVNHIVSRGLQGTRMPTPHWGHSDFSVFKPRLLVDLKGMTTGQRWTIQTLETNHLRGMTPIMSGVGLQVHRDGLDLFGR